MRLASIYTGLVYEVVREANDEVVLMDPEHGEFTMDRDALTDVYDDTPKEPESVAVESVVTDPVTGGRKGTKPQQPAQIPPEFLLALGEHYAKGMSKYPDVEAGLPNWARGFAWSLSANSLLRHFLAWLNGEEFDEDGNPNLIAVAWHAATLFTFQAKGLGTDDRPVY